MRVKGGQGLEEGSGVRGHSERDKGRCANLGTSLHGVPQLTLNMGSILIGQAQWLLLEWGEKERSVWVTRDPQDHAPLPGSSPQGPGPALLSSAERQAG